MALRRLTILMLAAGLVAPAALAVTWTVDDDRPADFASIQSAIVAASNDDEIVVRPGRYRETLNFLGKQVTVRSETGPAETVIYLEGEARIVLLNGGSTLRGFTITGGRSRVGAGIRVTDGAQPRIEDNVITGNVAARDGSAFPAFGGGIAVDTLARPVITRNVIAGNLAEGDGQGLLAYGGAIDVADDTSAVITDNVIAGNRSTDSGGGISLGVTGAATPLDVTHNTIVGNEAGSGATNTFSFGGGILVGDGAETVLRNNAIADNVSAFQGGGVYFFATGLQGITYASNDFDGNVPDPCGGLPSSKCNGGQLFVPPLFQDAAAGIYRLRSDSPIIDQGSATGVPAIDADGLARSADGDLDGIATPDIGAFENQRELTRLRFDTKTDLAWDGSASGTVQYQVYRDALPSPGAGPLGSCLVGGLALPATSDGTVPQAGGGFVYLVRGRGSVAGSLGFRSDGSERTPAAACP